MALGRYLAGISNGLMEKVVWDQVRFAVTLPCVMHLSESSYYLRV
jgi:hypothetical protein